MTVVEATLWAIGSVIALGTLAQLAQKVAPALQNDVASFSLCQVVAYLALLVALRGLYFPRSKATDIFGLGRSR